LYLEACKYIQYRKEKSQSLNGSKTKQKLSGEDALRLIKDRFTEINKYKDLISKIKCNKYTIPDWKAKYPKGGFGNENLFNHYNVYFVEGNVQKQLSFYNIQQVTLFQFLNSTLDIKGIKINIPESPLDCNRILEIISKDYNKYFVQIKGLLKINRSKANAVSIYRNVLLR